MLKTETVPTQKRQTNKVFTVGCRLNQAESDILRTLRFDWTAQTIIVNTCAVTQEAVRSSWKTIRRELTGKKSHHKLVVTGCLATLEKSKMQARCGIDLVLTQDEKIERLKQYPSITQRPVRSRPIVKIEDGCPNQCSFCIARVIRGQVRSIPSQVIADHINKLVVLGYQEIVLTGLNLGAYGIDTGSSLYELLKTIDTDSFRIRLSSIQPDTITDALLDLWSQKNLCRHLHIPLQSGDDNILKSMRRNYTRDMYYRLVEKISRRISGVNIGTDVIVGFPGEDDRAFRNTVDTIENFPFGYLHVFPYSARAGTTAALQPNNVPNAVKKERVRILRQLGESKKIAFRKKFIGTEMTVLAETRGRGITDNYLAVALDCTQEFQNSKLYNIIIKE